MRNWKQEKAWSDPYIPAIKRLLGEHLIKVPEDVTEDRDRCTDLITLGVPGGARVGCRVRRATYIRFKSDITIRTQGVRNHYSELHKIMDGWGDYFFYGIAAEKGLTFQHWVIGDLSAFRDWYRRRVDKGLAAGSPMRNHDGTEFRVFQYGVIGGFTIASSEGNVSRRQPRQKTLWA